MSHEPSAHEQLLARFLQHAESGLRRLTIEIGGEQVTLFMRQGRLRESCTCGLERCEHSMVVLQFLVEGAAQSSPAEVRVRSSMRPPAGGPASTPLGDAFEELCLATARAGIATPDSPSIKQALAQLRAAAPTPVPLSLARWIGRFQESLAAGEVGELSRLLDGALQWLEELTADSASFGAVANRRVWLGPDDASSAGPAVDSLAEVTLLEVAREWVSGLDRAAIERRYLVDLAGGEIFSEERRRGELEISVGPCPRIAQVAFAELETATRPRRARLLQYTLSVQVPEAPWQRVVALAHAEIESLRERYAADLSASPALAEPFAIFAPAEIDSSSASLSDQRGERLPLRNEAGQSGLDALLAATRGGEIVCVLGRLLGRAAGLALHPLSAIVRRGDWLELRRVT
ncbi:MAG: hypothetical protein JWN48_4841 [Myxococcaceae bacterium]|nr:hypothetical protein [Myxococcaceae bacterium]